MEQEQSIGIKLIQWFQSNQRVLPWRRDYNPYHVWISEIMLQQTRVDTVIAYFNAFIKAFPDLQRLANASEEEVLNMWKGLGYYSRARNIHQSAKILIQNFGGIFPENYEDIRKLPGIGDYTAGAIMSIAFNKPIAAVDGNVLRVVSRVLTLSEDISKSKTKSMIGKEIETWIPPNSSRDFCQALMELGALICVPNLPKCSHCPISNSCKALANLTQTAYPVKYRVEKNKPQYLYQAAIILEDNKILLEYRHEVKLLGKMWGVPLILKSTENTDRENFTDKYGLHLDIDLECGLVKHIFTHQSWLLTVSRFHMKGNLPESTFLKWVLLDELSTLPIPTAFQKVLSLGLSSYTN